MFRESKIGTFVIKIESACEIDIDEVEEHKIVNQHIAAKKSRLQ